MLLINHVLNPSVAGTKLFRKKFMYVNVAADALAPRISRTSEAMVLIMRDKQIRVFVEYRL